ENLHERPTLIWKLENGGSRDHRIETAYLAGSMKWDADYVLTVPLADPQRGARKARHPAGVHPRGVFRVPPLLAGAADDARRERDEADLAARRHRRPGEEAVRRGGTAVLLPEPAAPGLAAQRSGRGVLQAAKRSDLRSGHADAGRH